jgi:uncharacterized membrane protein
MIAGAAFCPSCGKRAGSPVVAQASGAQSSAPPASGLQSNIAGGLCYLLGLVSGIFFLATEPYKGNRFVRFHAFQSIFLSVAWIAAYLAVGILLSILPGMFWRLGWMLHSVVSLGFFCLWVFLMYKAYNHEEFKLPVIGDLAAKQA